MTVPAWVAPGLEGIIAKQKAAPHASGRGPAWLKV